MPRALALHIALNHRRGFARAWPYLLRSAATGSLTAMRNILQLQNTSEWRNTPNMLHYLQTLVALGDPLAQRSLAQVYEGGWLGQSVDMTQANALYCAAAEQGDAWAQFCVGTLYACGVGRERNDALAVHWYQLAAQQNVADAQCNLGFSYEIGRAPLRKSMEVANHWYALAADNGSIDAQFNLATSYWHAKGMSRDLSLAHGWCVRAAAGGHAKAAWHVARDFEKGWGVASDLSQALHYYAQSLWQGYSPARTSFERVAWRVDGSIQCASRSLAAGTCSQDVCAVISNDCGQLVFLADGAGGCSGGRKTAEALLDACRQKVANGIPENFEWADWLEGLDRSDEGQEAGGLCTVVLAWISDGVVHGASIGDSQAWLVRESDVFALTALQASRPLFGHGRAAITGFGPCELEGRLIVASDGLWRAVAAQKVEALMRIGDAERVCDALLTAARLPDETFADDVSLIVMTPIQGEHAVGPVSERPCAPDWKRVR